MNRESLYSINGTAVHRGNRPPPATAFRRPGVQPTPAAPAGPPQPTAGAARPAPPPARSLYAIPHPGAARQPAGPMANATPVGMDYESSDPIQAETDRADEGQGASADENGGSGNDATIADLLGPEGMEHYPTSGLNERSTMSLP